MSTHSGRHRGDAPSRGLSRVRMGWAAFRDDPWAAISVALLVLLVAAMVTAVPRWVADLDSRQVEHEIAATTSQQRDLIAVDRANLGGWPGPPTGGGDASVQDTWGERIAQLERVRQQQPEPLRSAMQPAQFTLQVDEVLIEPKEGNDLAQPWVNLMVDPYLQEHTELAEGRWPGAVPAPTVDETTGQVVPTSPIEVVLSTAAAERYDWAVGETRSVTVSPGVQFTLTGTYRVDDPQSPHWESSTTSVEPYLVTDPNAGLIGHTVAYLDPAATGAMPFTISSSVSSLSVTTRLWYPLDGSTVRGHELPDLLVQLRSLSAGTVPVDGTVAQEEPPGGTPVPQVQFTSELTDTLEQLWGQQSTTHAVLAIVAAGPIGATVAVLALGARLIVSRRRPALALAGARGASPAQLRALMALEGLVLGVPAAAAGHAVATWLLPGRSTVLTAVAPALVALAPAILMALTTSTGGLRQERRDLAGRSTSRLRWIAEALLVGAAGVSVLLLRGRGLGEAAGPADVTDAGKLDGLGVDPLVAAAPVLLTAAACVVALRLFPLPMRVLEGWFRRRTGLVPFLGAARGVRDTAGGLVPAAALVVGVSVAALSTVLLTTIERGAEEAAWAAVGADLRISGPVLDPDLVDRIEALPGVATVATVADEGGTPVRGSATTARVSMLVVESRQLGRVQSDVPGATPVPPLDEAAGGSAAPIVLSEGLAARLGTGPVEVIGYGPATVVGTVESLTGIRTGSDFFLIDRAVAEELGGRPVHPRLGLIRLEPGVDTGVAAAALSELAPSSAVEDPQADLAAFRASPAVSGLTAGFVAAVLLAALLSAVAVLMTQLLPAPARRRLLAVLRTLGLDRRQTDGIVAWELLPLLAVSFTVGIVLGFAVPLLVLASVDLTTLTGGESQPALHVDPWVLLAVLAAVLVAVLAAVAASTTIAQRTDNSRQLRAGEER